MFIKKFLAWIIVISLGVLLYSISMPTYTNEIYKQALDDRGMKAMTSHDFPNFKVYYYKKLEDLRTDKPQIMDISFGMLIASLTLYCFTLNNKVKRYHNFKAVKTLKKGSLILLSNFMWLLLIPGAYWHYLFRSGRGDYPWFVDDVSIPLESKLPLILIGWVLLNIFIIVFSHKSKFPAHLFNKQPRFYQQGRLWDLFWWVLIFLNTLFLGLLIWRGDHISIIVDLYLTYLLLSLRAGKIHAKRVEMAQQPESESETDGIGAAQ